MRWSRPQEENIDQHALVSLGVLCRLGQPKEMGALIFFYRSLHCRRGLQSQAHGSVRTQDTAGNLPRKWGMPLSKRAERGEKTYPEVPFWRESGESSRPFFDRIPSSDRTNVTSLLMVFSFLTRSAASMPFAQIDHGRQNPVHVFPGSFPNQRSGRLSFLRLQGTH
jgi:hypothetical protein